MFGYVSRKSCVIVLRPITSRPPETHGQTKRWWHSAKCRPCSLRPSPSGAAAWPRLLALSFEPAVLFAGCLESFIRTNTTPMVRSSFSTYLPTKFLRNVSTYFCAHEIYESFKILLISASAVQENVD